MSSPTPDLLLEVFRHGKTPDQTRREADYIETLLDLTPPARLLDVPVGVGRLAVELAARGYHVTGVDIAAPLLDDAQRAAAERGAAEHFVMQQGDMRALPWAGEFDAAYCFWESFGLFDDDGNRAFLAAVARTLKPGGRFVMDTHTVETFFTRGQQARDWTWIADDLLVLERHSYDHVAGTLIRDLTVLSGAQQAHHTLINRLYTYRALVALCAEVGFTTVEGYTWPSLLPFAIGAARLVLVAQKA